MLQDNSRSATGPLARERLTKTEVSRGGAPLERRLANDECILMAAGTTAGGVDSRNIRMKDEKQTPPSNFVAVNQLSTTASRLQAGP